MNKCYLPEATRANREKIKTALNYHWESSNAEHMQRARVWGDSYWYLSGLRNVALQTPRTTGLPSLTMTDRQGKRHVRCEMAFLQTITEIGRYQSINLNPVVKRRQGLTLGGLRDSSVLQATADHLAARLLTEQFQAILSMYLVVYGMVGVAVLPDDSGDNWEPIWEFIPPWELRPLPSGIQGSDAQGGVTWGCYVPREWAREVFRKVAMIPTRPDTDEEVREAIAGSKLQSDLSPQSIYAAGMGGIGAVATPNAGIETNSSGAADADMEYVLLKQSWLYDNATHRTNRYIVQLGKAEPIIDIDYTNPKVREALDELRPICPVVIFKASEVGGWWPRAFAERLIVVNKEAESLLSDGVENLRIRDALTFLAIPGTNGINKRNFKEARKNRYFFYVPELGVPHHEPKLIAPPRAGDDFGRAINMLFALQKELTGQGDLLYGGMPGRTDSADAASIIVEQSGTPLAHTGGLIASAMTHLWKASLSYGRYQQKVSQKDIALSLRRIDESVLGVTLNRETNTIELGSTAIPDPLDYEMTIRSKSPSSKEQKLARLDRLVETQKISDAEYIIACHIHDLDVPIVDNSPALQWEIASTENVFLYNDGQTPGTVDGYDEADNHLIHYLNHMRVVASPEFRAASDEVQKVILSHVAYHKSKLASLPEGLQGPDSFGRPPGQNPQLYSQMGMQSPAGMGTAPGMIQ